MKWLQSILILCLSGIVILVGCKKKDDDSGPAKVTINQDITSPTTWIASNEYYIEGEIYVDADLTIEAGTHIKFSSTGALYFGYSHYTTLTAIGTIDKPIIFSPQSNSWIGLGFYNYVQPISTLEFCNIEYAGTYSTAAIGFHGAKININNCKINNAKTTGISSDSDQQGFVSFNNNIISNCNSHAIVMRANTIHTLGTNNVISCITGNGIKIDGGNFSQNTATTWKKMTVPYYVSGTVNIDGNLTIEPGSVFKFETNAVFKIGQNNNTTFTANGADADKIIFTSSANAKTTGDWKGLWFYSQTINTSKLNYCDISYGGAPGDPTDANIKVSGITDFTISNCNISHSKGWGIFLENSTLSANSIGNTFSATNVLGNVGP